MAPAPVLPRTPASRATLRLWLALMLVFAVLSLPMLFFVLIYGQQRNEAAIVAALDSQLEVIMDRGIQEASELISTAARVMAIVGEAVADGQADIKQPQSEGFLWRSLIAANQLDALYVSLEDGFHRVVTRVDEDRRRYSPQIPAQARWHASYIDEFSVGAHRARHRRYYASWPSPIGPSLDEATTLDLRTLEHYVAAQRTRKLAVAAPSLNPDTGAPVMSLGLPIERQGQFIGIVGANATLSLVSAYLRENRASRHSITLITDELGRIVAHSGPAAAEGRWELKTIAELGDKRLIEALAYRERARKGPVRFTTRSGEEMSIATKPFPSTFGKSWEILLIAPTSDFVGELRATSRAVSLLGTVLIFIELLIIFVWTRGVSSRIKRISNQFKSVSELELWVAPVRQSRITEVADLQNGFQLLLSALGSFAKFVPQGVVRQLVNSGSSIVPGVEPKSITIFFCDLEGFSSLSEKLAPDALLHQLTQYFSAMTESITQESGTIDKFIGDAVMAFWGAPSAREDHALRACAAALRAKRRMEVLYRTWASEGRPPMRVRIGLHSAEVLVGNIGSADRLSYTAIGDGVNVSSRLEGINKLFGTTICISGSLHAQLSDTLVARPLRPVQVKGRIQEIMIFELLGLKGTSDPELAASSRELELAKLSAAAVSLRMQGDIQGCIGLYRSLLERYPDDQVTRRILDELTTAS